MLAIVYDDLSLLLILRQQNYSDPLVYRNLKDNSGRCRCTHRVAGVNEFDFFSPHPKIR